MVNTKFLLCIIGILLLFPAVSAGLNVTSTSGTTFIIWNWNVGTNVSAMYIDGRLMCAYESTIPSITVTNISSVFSGSCHTISVWDDLGNFGNNTACLTGGTSTGSYGGGGSNDSGMNMSAIVGIAGGLVGGMIGAMFISGRLRKRNN